MVLSSEKEHPLDGSSPPVREESAFDNMCKAIDKFEIYERVTICNHKSFLGHGSVFKVTSDILEVADIWAIDLSPLELNNACTKSIAEKTGSRRIEFSTKQEQQRKGPKNAIGPCNLTSKAKYSTTLAKSTLRTMLGQQQLRRGDGVLTMPASRRNERLFGVTGSGRSKNLSAGIKLENLGKDYNPREDTCVKAFVRFLAQSAAAAADPTDSAVCHACA